MWPQGRERRRVQQFSLSERHRSPKAYGCENLRCRLERIRCHCACQWWGSLHWIVTCSHNSGSIVELTDHLIGVRLLSLEPRGVLGLTNPLIEIETALNTLVWCMKFSGSLRWQLGNQAPYSRVTRYGSTLINNRYHCARSEGSTGRSRDHLHFNPIDSILDPQFSESSKLIIIISIGHDLDKERITRLCIDIVTRGRYNPRPTITVAWYAEGVKSRRCTLRNCCNL